MAAIPLLTIAIPTYNREVCLRLLLESICGQVTAAMSSELEVCVFDNCSNDGTRQLVQSYLPGCGVLRYVRNDENIGPDANFRKAFLAATGSYFWLVGDDELLFDGAIARVLDLCRSESFGCAYLNSLPAVLDRMPTFARRKLDGDVRRRRFAAYAFAQAANYRLTFMSGSVINRQAVLAANPDIASDIDRFAGSNLIHLSWILPAIASRPVSFVVTTPLFASTIANSGGYDPVRVFVVNLSDLFGYYLGRLDPGAKRFVRWFTMIGWFPKVVFDLRFRGRYRRAGFAIRAESFPSEMRSGLAWWLFERGVLNGSVVFSGLAMLALKLWHRVMQRVYLARTS